ncbi:hypothetical protein [Streptococcus suis]|uniref:hypothetical protein n=1 Tax=Streptococcus suis TaxID=1307 RepID=UPI000CF43977|nr:hypothetical protein [Streptococcus suis]
MTKYKFIIILFAIIALATGTIVSVETGGVSLFMAMEDLGWLSPMLPLAVFIMILLLIMDNLYTEIGLPIAITFTLGLITNQLTPEAKLFFLAETVESGTAIYHIKLLLIAYSVIVYTKRRNLIVLLPIIYLIATDNFVLKVLQIIQDIPTMFSSAVQTTQEFISKLINALITFGTAVLVIAFMLFSKPPTAEEQAEIDEHKEWKRNKEKLSELHLMEHQMNKNGVDWYNPMYQKVRDEANDLDKKLRN